MKKLCRILFLTFSLICVIRAEDAAEEKGSLPAPEKGEMRLNELQAQLVDMDGKIIETLVNCVFAFEQVKEAQYRANCGFYGGGEGIVTTQRVLIPEEGKEFFQDLAKKTGAGPCNNQRVYLSIKGKEVRAVGTRYSKSKGEYSW